MRAVIQRVKKSSVSVENKIIGQIHQGLLVLLGISAADDKKETEYLADKIMNLRIFEDTFGKMNLSLLQTGGEILVVSQFTLYGDTRKGRRPSFTRAASPDLAIPLYEYFIEIIRQKNVPVETGCFGEMMDVSLINDGPVTLIVKSKNEA